MNPYSAPDTSTSARVPNFPDDGLAAVLQSAGFWVYLLVALTYIVFAYRYWRYSPWRADSVGKGLMTMALSGAAILLNALIVIFLGPDFPGREVIRLGLLGGAGVAMGYMVKNLVELQGGWRQKDKVKRTRLRDRRDVPPPPRPNVK